MREQIYRSLAEVLMTLPWVIGAILASVCLLLILRSLATAPFGLGYRFRLRKKLAESSKKERKSSGPPPRRSWFWPRPKA